MNTFKRSFSYLKKYKWLALGAFLMMNLVTFCSLVIPQFIQRIIDDGITPKNLDAIKTISFSLLLITLVRALASFFNTYWAQKASHGIAYDIRNEMYKKLEYLEISFHDRHNIGQLLTRTTNDVEAVRTFFGTGFLQIIAALITLIGSIIILVTTNSKLFFAVSIMLPLIIIIFFFIFKKLRPLFGQIQQQLGQLNNVLQENILGIRIVKGFTAEASQQKKYNAQNQEIYDIYLRLIKVFATGFPVVFFISNLATVAVIWIGGKMVIDENMTIGTLIAFNSYLAFLVQPIFQLGMVMQQFAKANASSSRIFSILDTDNTIKNIENPIPYQSNQCANITFKNVSFAYLEDSEAMILKNINLTIPSGKNTAIIGKTGSGKSTLINLIPRFYDPSEGEVLLDGVSVKKYELESLREHMGMVLQEVRLLNSSIRENICYGKPDATEAQIREVCDIAQVTPFLENLEGGLDFVVGEGGKNLSGGQRQRVAIARMLLVEPKILVLDDATSALDTHTENALIKAANPYLNSDEYTVIVISQKPETIQKADLILVMDNGEIVAQGTHQELLLHSEFYRNLIDSPYAEV